MDTGTETLDTMAATSKSFGQMLLTIGENRLELLMVAVQEEREVVLHAILLALGVAVCALLAGITLTAAIVVYGWDFSPIAVLLILAGIYGAAAAWLYRILTRVISNWQTLSVSLDQLRKDRESLEEAFS